MKKTLIILVVVLVGIYAVYVLAGRSGGVSDSLSEYFGNRITTLGFGEGAPMPIEGYDAGLLMSAFPGFVPQDFDRVKSFEGIYEYKNGELVFERVVNEPISSAERTVSAEGYGTLLENTSERLGITINSEEDVDTLVNSINTEDVLAMSLGGSASAFGINIMPTRVLEDSRCPADVNCIQAGTVRLETVVSDSSGESTRVFRLAEATTTPGYEITLARVGPEKMTQGAMIDDNEYIFYFDIKKK